MKKKMTALKTHFDRLFLFIIVLIFINLTDSRYLKSEKTENELSKQNAGSNVVDDDDFDLETVLNDYYDDLWQDLLSSISSSVDSGKSKTNEDDKKRKLNTDYDYMSDMAVPEPEVDGKKSKGFGRDSVTVERKNFTWPFVNNSSQNGSSEDNGLLEAMRANRERIKDMRVKSIIDQVLKFRGGSSKPNETIPSGKQYNILREIYEKNINKIKNDDGMSSYNEKVQSFYPLCNVPRNTDEDVWSDPYSMNLLFDLDYPSPQEDMTIMIASAKLKLYKLPQENDSSSHADLLNGEIKLDKTHNNFGILHNEDDRQIRVSVYWYTRSLRRHRVKKKLLDSQMLSYYAPKWAEFNIRPAVRTWKESGRNFGLVVTVEDEDGVLLPVEQYIQSMNCSKWTANVRPIPSVLMDPINQYYIENQSENKPETAEENRNEENKQKIYFYQPLLFPILDLRTTEVPNSDVKNMALVNSAKKALESKFFNLSRRGFNMGNDSVTIFLKKSNVDLRDISRLSRIDKWSSKNKEAKSGETRVSNFQNVPIGSPTPNQNGSVPTGTKRNRGASEDSEVKIRVESIDI